MIVQVVLRLAENLYRRMSGIGRWLRWRREDNPDTEIESLDRQLQRLVCSLKRLRRWPSARPLVETGVLSVYLRHKKFLPWRRVHRPYGKNVLLEVGLLTVCVLVTLPYDTPPKPLQDSGLTKAS